MKKLLFWVVIAICAWGIWKISQLPQDPLSAPPASFALAAETQPAPTHTPKPTRTPDPTATIGYEATIAVAEQARQQAQSDAWQAGQVAHDAWSTAEAANVQVLSITAQAEQARLEQEGMTAQANADRMVQLSWTATALPTMLPITQTAIQEARTQQAVVLAQMAMTQAAPTMVVAMAVAHTSARMAPVNAWIKVIGLLSISLFCLGAGAFLGVRTYLDWQARPEQEALVEDASEEPLPKMNLGTTVSVKHADAGFMSLMTYQVPCTEKQLTELADRVLNRHESLAINRFEGAGTSWTRVAVLRVRSFMQLNRYVKSMGGGQVDVNGDGEAFLRGWLEEKALPRGMEFAHEIPNLAEGMSHDHENHGPESGAGEGNE